MTEKLTYRQKYKGTRAKALAPILREQRRDLYTLYYMGDVSLSISHTTKYVNAERSIVTKEKS